MDEKVRCFVCVEIDPGIRKSLGAWLTRLRALAPRIRWVDNAALHITMKFCGEIEPKKLIKLQAAMEQAFSAARIPPFDLEISGVGAFPGWRQPRVLWVGLGGDDDQLYRLFEVVEKAGNAVGLERERRPFHPHVTIARIKTPAELPVQLMRDLNDENAGQGRWTVRYITLMQSDLYPDGPVYTPLARYLLNTTEVGN
jgi:2'-5' RNA ligase